MRRWWILVTIVVGCRDAPSATPNGSAKSAAPPSGAQVLCLTDEQCPAPQVCSAGVCEAELAPDPDAGLPEGDAARPSERDADLDVGSVPDLMSFDGRGGDLATADAGDDPFDGGPLDSADPGDAGVPLDSGVVPVFDFSGCVVVNLEQPATQRYVIGAGVRLAAGESLVLVRGAERTEFEANVGPLLATVHFVRTDAGTSGAPIINGGESFQLEAPDGALLDGPTPVGRPGEGYVRTGPMPLEFTAGPELGPGTAPPLSPLDRPRIVGWSDRSGNGQFHYEWIELRFDP